ncbi:MAG: DUF1730 domain-containing protein [Oscillospiraceae bacterium]|nr:DUF1730 domain-containing protein [Oscillospiraceae bacterium]
MLSKILPDYGVCGFELLEPHLIHCRALARLPQNPQSVVAAVFPYLLPEEHYRQRNVARFAVVEDYHKLVLARLEKACKLLEKTYPHNLFVPFTDNSPIPEKPAAVLCGLGQIGKNALFIHPRWGSWVFLGCIVSDLPPGEFGAKRGHDVRENACGDCDICEKKCPANAIGNGKVDTEKCLSFRSQRKDADREALARHSGVLWGCDICQEVCPQNRNAPAQPLPEFIDGARPVFEPLAPARVWAWRFK